MVYVIVHLIAPFVKKSKNFEKPVRRKMREVKNTVIAVIGKKTLIWFVKILLQTLKCPFD